MEQKEEVIILEEIPDQCKYEEHDTCTLTKDACVGYMACYLFTERQPELDNLQGFFF